MVDLDDALPSLADYARLQDALARHNGSKAAVFIESQERALASLFYELRAIEPKTRTKEIEAALGMALEVRGTFSGLEP